MAIQTLNEIAHLKNSECGKPYPRHGLQLLYWFAHHCVYFADDKPLLLNRDFGFKDFHNNEDLLPDQDNPYYEVGNLNTEKASKLKDYVRKNYVRERDITNSDRIIICLEDNGRRLDRIYVTRHLHGQTNFDQNHTYRISKCLLKIISNFSDPNEFLRAVGYVVDQRPAKSSHITMPDERPANHSVPVMGKNNTSVQRPGDSHQISMPEDVLQTSTPSKGWWCTIL